MARRLTEEELEQIKGSVDLVELIGQDIALTKRGKNYLGLCPFHNEKTPSFNVSPDKQFFHCFGCGKSGTVFNYLMFQKNIDFMSAVKEIAEIGNVKIDGLEEERTFEKPHQRLYDIHHEAATFFHHLLVNTEYGREPLAYLKERGIDEQIIEHFKIGLSPKGQESLLHKLLIGKGYQENELVESGLFVRNEQGNLRATFFNRIIFPLTDEYNHVIAFSGRTMDAHHPAKYLNSPQTKLFNKSHELFHLAEAKPVIRKTKEVFVMEGFMDVIAAYRVGILNTVASMGTSLTGDHLDRLSKLSKKIIFAFDGDSAGQNAIYKALQLVNQAIQTEVVIFPEKLDPDDYLKKYGNEALENLMQHARSSQVSFLIDFTKSQYNLSNEAEQLDFVQKMLPVISKVKSIVAQDVYLTQLTKLAPLVSKEALIQELSQRQPLNNNGIVPKPQQRQQTGQKNLIRLSQLEHAERQLLARAIEKPAVLQELIDNQKFNFKHPIYQKIYVQIIAYFLRHDIIKVTDILASLENEERSVLFEISSLELDDEITDGEIKDLVAIIEKQSLVDQLNDLIQRQREAKVNGNFEAELNLGLEIIQLQQEIQK
ncbi:MULTISPECIES: DNA primase [unclassified Enterococcus]|uniref:DNA primase n=1 Tax=unclassified Enterococcus TaxID=2608891 RepID=UPI001554E681|nr:MULTISPECIES: DNA primase [unclassified Enterococcus]MBS7576298.1 DNA primase [Enterococcus sp. MMGLQ5-2]MBS7583531.1 DNA primase [Enterococcus sp. MMGLQ5-1]NPD11393.1 DNA primase [Enterococcus sp. MMGLQ5-1]NPD36136.1 DNA primase [Enterococcus sp. MMGLQ5-2]